MKVVLLALVFSSFSAVATPCDNWNSGSFEYKQCLYDFYTREVTKPVIGEKKTKREVASLTSDKNEMDQLRLMEDDYLE